MFTDLWLRVNIYDNGGVKYYAYGMVSFSAAADRNKGPIAEKLKGIFEKFFTGHRPAVRVLEIGSGTGQHAVHFAEKLPQQSWQTTELKENIANLHKNLQTAGVQLPEPLLCDINEPEQLACIEKAGPYNLLYTANTMHIMREREVELFFEFVEKLNHSGFILVIYGPFKIKGEFTSESNRAFDEMLNPRKSGQGIRDLEVISSLARAAGLNLLECHDMPANNQLLLFCSD